jgi:DNA-binding MarR family transcriptional regulator
MPQNGRDQEATDSLPPSCRYVLSALADADANELTLQELDNRLCHRKRTIAEALKTLENRGYIHKKQDSDDLRQVVAELVDTRTFTPRESDT